MRFQLKLMKISVVILIILAAVYAFGRINAGSKEYNSEDYYKEDIQNINIGSKCVAIDSGHGGIDPGKIGSGGIYEKNVNLAIATKLKILLEQSGITVIMTRSDDNGLYDESDTNKKAVDMKRRCSIINESDADIAVSIHQNSYVSEQSKGSQVFYYKQSEEGKRLANILQKHLISELDTSNKRTEKADSSYYMLRNTNVPTVIAECGFLSNPEEARKLNSSDYQQKVAQAIYNGIMEYLTDNDING